MDLQKLPVISTLSDHIDVVQHDQVKFLRITHPKLTAGISLYGGHVVSFKPTGFQDLIWMSDEAIYDAKLPLRGGIPICWPWFGPIASPSHGFVRNQQWQLVEHRENENGVVVCLGLQDNADTQVIWPYRFDAKLYVEMGETLKVTLDVKNTDEKPWTFSGALHSYLNVGDIHQLAITGMGDRYIDKLQDSKECEGPEVLKLTAGIDRIYTQPAAVINVADPEFDRQLTIENQGHNSAVLWNPWANGAANIKDMSNSGYLTMMCVESTVFAPCISAGITLAPGESHQLITTIAQH